MLTMSMAVTAFILIRGSSGAIADLESDLNAEHYSPILVLDDEEVELGVRVVCPWTRANDQDGLSTDETCEPSVTLHLEQGRDSQELELDPDETGINFSATLEGADLDGASYYFEVADGGTNQTITVPTAGEDGPYQVHALPEDAPVIELDEHRAGQAQEPEQTVLAAEWGDGDHAVGLDTPPEGEGLVSGPQAFDVTAEGDVLLLDTIKQRVLEYSQGNGPPEAWPHEVAPAASDIAATPAGAAVLANPAGAGELSALERDNRDAHRVEVPAEHRGSQLTAGPAGVAVQEVGSELWSKADGGDGDFRPVEPNGKAATAGRPEDAGQTLITAYRPNEFRVALTNGNRITRSWRITDDNGMGALAAVEAEPSGRLTLAVTEGDEEHDEYRVLRIRGDELTAEAAIAYDEWAAMNHFGKVRLVGDDVYEMSTTPDGATVQRYSIEEGGR